MEWNGEGRHKEERTEIDRVHIEPLMLSRIEVQNYNQRMASASSGEAREKGLRFYVDDDVYDPVEGRQSPPTDSGHRIVMESALCSLSPK